VLEQAKRSARMILTIKNFAHRLPSCNMILSFAKKLTLAAERLEIICDKLHEPTNPTDRFLMKPDPMTLKAALRRRELELQKIIRQMKQDNLHSSPVYKNLESELELVKNRLIPPAQQE
jgi:hypothetical protein